MKSYKREDIEKLIYDVFDALDPTETNSNKYRDLFSSMNDKKFDSFMRKFLSDKKENFILDIVEFERTIDMDKCEKAANVLGIPLYEYVYFRHLTGDKDNPVSTIDKCLVGYINVKRTQQLLFKKNGLSPTASRRSAITGQVVDDDKNARDSDIEASMLVSLGAKDILRELHGPRADDDVMKNQMINDINNKGFVSLDDLDSNPTNKVSLMSLTTYLTAAGIHSDLIGDNYILPKSLE